jgi:hypothetical protein
VAPSRWLPDSRNYDTFCTRAARSLFQLALSARSLFQLALSARSFSSLALSARSLFQLARSFSSLFQLALSARSAQHGVARLKRSQADLLRRGVPMPPVPPLVAFSDQEVCYVV